MHALLTPLILAFSLLATAAANDYDEAVDGDISDNRNNPTCFPLDAGVNRLTATQQGSGSGGATDRDYLTIIIPRGLALRELRLVAFSHATELAFMGFQEGTTFVGSPFMTMAGDLLGGHVYGLPDLGQDLLPAMNALPGVQGFSVPLPSGSYTFWFNQGAQLTTASFEFDLVRDTVGSSYCALPPNSTGQVGVLFGSGSAALAENEFVLVARNLPPGQTALLLASRTQGFVLHPGGSLGHLCLGGSVGRFPHVLVSDSHGALEARVDWQSLPLPTGTVAASVGEAWHFQVWHREPGGMSHFTPAWSLVLE